MASLVINGDTSGGITLSAPAVAGSNTQTLVAATGTLAPLISGTAVTASGTSVDFTGIPSWVKRITVMFNGVSTSGTSGPQIQIGSSSGVDSTGYLGSNVVAVNGAGTAAQQFTTGFGIGVNTANWNGSVVVNGSVTLSLLAPNTWVAQGSLGASHAAAIYFTGGSKTLSGNLDRVRITTVNGTDTFDAGTINILYE